MNDDDLWAEYARLSDTADSDRLDDTAWAADEALDEILNRIETKREFSPGTIPNLLRNRARKHRQRRLILARNAPVLAQSAANDNERHDAADALRRAAKSLTSLEARLLFAIAEGRTYGELAGAEKVPAGTIKTWVRRARLKLKR